MKKITLKHRSLAVIASLTILALAAVADGPPKTPDNYKEGFEEGELFFDDAVGVVHIRQSHSIAETDYALGINAADGENYARLLVQPTLASVGGINGDQVGACKPGAAESDNAFGCGGPFTEWGLPFGGFDGSFDSGIPIGHGTTTSIDIYLDMAFAATNNSTVNGKDYRFDWDSDLLDRNGQFLQDYIFNVALGTRATLAAREEGADSSWSRLRRIPSALGQTRTARRRPVRLKYAFPRQAGIRSRMSSPRIATTILKLT